MKPIFNNIFDVDLLIGRTFATNSYGMPLLDERKKIINQSLGIRMNVFITIRGTYE